MTTLTATTSEQDIDLKLRTMRYFWSQGYFVRRNVPVVESAATSQYTDIDVLGVRIDEELNATYVLSDCKSGITDGTRERLFWLSGVMKYFGASRGLFIRTQMMPRKYVELAEALGIVAIPADQMTELEKSYSIDAQKFVGPFCREHGKAEIILSSLKQHSRETLEYIRTDYWGDPPHLQTFSLMGKCRDLLRIQHIDEDNRMFQLAYIMSLLSLSVIRFARQVLFMPPSDREEVIGLGLLGGRTGYLEKKELMRNFHSFMTTEIEKRYKSKYPVTQQAFIEQLVPSYTKYLVDLILRLCREPRVALTLPRIIDLLAFESVLKDGKVLAKDIVGGVEGVAVEDATRIAKDFLAFAQRSGVTNQYLEHVLEEGLRRIES